MFRVDDLYYIAYRYMYIHKFTYAQTDKSDKSNGLPVALLLELICTYLYSDQSEIN